MDATWSVDGTPTYSRQQNDQTYRITNEYCQSWWFLGDLHNERTTPPPLGAMLATWVPMRFQSTLVAWICIWD